MKPWNEYTRDERMKAANQVFWAVADSKKVKKLPPREQEILLSAFNWLANGPVPTPGWQALLPNLPDGLKAWLETGERGISSETIAHRMVPGLMFESMNLFGECAPSDPSDLDRCRKLLEAVPSFRPRLPEMARVSAQWGVLVEHWDELIALLMEELPNAEAPRCYERMRELLDGVQKGK